MRMISEFIRKNGPEVHALRKGGLPDFLTVRRPAPLSEGIPAFCYHLADPPRFETDMRFLAKNGYITIFADDMLAYLRRPPLAREKSIVLTFDDGAVNFHRVAFPLLKQYHQKAVLFISPGLHLPAGAEKRSADRPCTWEELDEMHESGLVDIQSHTWAHRSPINWPEQIRPTGFDAQCVKDQAGSCSSIEDDLRMSRKSIEERFDKVVKHLAWPCYYANDTALQAALSAGYEGLWGGVLPGRPLNLPGQSAHEIVRLSGEFLRRLPGTGRQTLLGILTRRYFEAIKARIRSRPRIRGGQTSSRPYD